MKMLRGRYSSLKVFCILLSFQLTVLPALSLTTSDVSGYSEGLWSAECGSRLPRHNSSVALLPSTQEPRPINESLVFILLMSRTAVRICDELNNTVLLEVNKTQSEIKGDEVSPLDSLLPGKYLPNRKQIKHIIGDDVTRLSRVGVFLELARNDTPEYKGKITELERKTMEILCEMYQVMKVLKAEVKSNVSRDLVTPDYTDLDDIAKHQRNFFITRASRTIFQHFIDKLEKLTNMTFKDRIKKI